MILSLGEDRCEGENDKVFTHSALIASDLRRTCEGVKAKKRNQLRRAYVRARSSGLCEGACFRRSSCVKWGRGEEKSPVCARLFPCFAQSVRVAGDAAEWASRCALSFLVRCAALWGRL